MIMKANKQIGFININEESIDKIIQNGEVVFERGFLREKTSTTLPIAFGGVGKDLKDYKIYGNTKQQLLPDGYTQVDYIESNGNQYINTGVNADSDLSLKVDMLCISGNAQTHMGAIKNDNSVYTRHHFTLNPTKLGLYAGQTNNMVDILQPQDNKRHFFDIDIYNKKIAVDSASPIDVSVSSFDTELNYWLFARNSNNSTNISFSQIRIYSLKMYVKNIMVRNFIPCYRNSDNEIGLYDLVNNVFYTNQRTGVFTYGSVAPTPDTPIEMVSCGDKTKNLIDINLSQSTSNATKSVDGNNLTITCNANNQNCYVSYDTSNINPNKTYYFSYTAVADNYAGVMIRAYKNDNTYEVVVDFTQTTEANLNFNVPDTTVYLKTFLYASRSTTGGSIGDKTIYSNVHLGEDPYGYKIPVNVRSDNLFDKEHYNYIAAYLSNTNKLTAGSGEDCTALYIKCKPNTTYTVSKTSLFGNDRFCLFDTSSLPTIGDTALSYVGTRSGNDNSKNLTIITNSTAQYLCIFVKASSTAPSASREDIINTLQIVEGSTAPSKYIPYYNETTNIYLDEPLRKIDRYSDYIDFINGKVVRNIKEHIFAGTNDDNYVFNSDNTNTLGINILPNKIDSPALKPIGYEAPPIICDKFSYYGDISDKEHIYSSNGTQIDETKRISNIRLYLNKPRLEGYSSSMTNAQKIELLKTWLSSNNITVDYILLSPTQESITLPNIPTIDGNNTLNIETEITPSQVYIKYKSNS